MAGGKIQFTARKDPLLRDRDEARTRRRPAIDRAPAQPVELDVVEAPVVPATAVPAARDLGRSQALEEPAGVIAVPGGRSATGEPAEKSRGEAAALPTRPPVAAVSGRRVQTSVSLPSRVWRDLERTADAARVGSGELLNAVLRTGLPDGPESALGSLERLLRDLPADDELLEEHNFRLSVEVRETLDRFAKTLAPVPRARPPRSLLVRAILRDHAVTDPEQARQLINALRVQGMRDSLRAASGQEAEPAASGG
jgi:hypothetical protein